MEDLNEVEHSLAHYSLTQEKINELGELINPVTISSNEDRKTAAVHARVMRDHRNGLEEFRLEHKRKLTAAGKALDAEAHRIQSMMDPIEQGIKEKIKAWDQIKEDEKAEKAKAEQDRVDAIKQLIETNLAFHSQEFCAKTITQMNAAYDALDDTAILEPVYNEFTSEAISIKSKTLECMHDAIIAKIKQVKEKIELKEQQDKAEADRKENERVAAELAERQRVMEAEQAEKQRVIDAEIAAREAELNRKQFIMDEELAQKRREIDEASARVAADAKRMQDEKDAAAKAEQDRIDQERMRKEADERAAEKVKQDAIDADKARELDELRAKEAEELRVANLTDSEFIHEYSEKVRAIGVPEIANIEIDKKMSDAYNAYINQIDECINQLSEPIVIAP